MASWIDLPTAWPDARSLDAHRTKIGGQNNADAVYENAVANCGVTLRAKQANSAGWYGGPYPIPMRLNRDGFWRSPTIAPLIAATAANRTINGFIIPWWYQPDDDIDAVKTWEVPGSTATLAWMTPAILTLGFGFNPQPRMLASGDDPGMVRTAWLVWEWQTGSSSAWFGGFHLAEGS